MFRSSKFGRLRGVTKGGSRVIGRGESNENLIRGRKRRRVGRFDKTTERDRGIIRPEGRNMFIVLCPFCEVNSGGISLASFEVSLGSVGTLPFSIDRERAGGGTIAEHNSWLMPIDMGVMLSKPSITEDNVIMS